MKGLLLKDYYLIKSVLYINIVIFVVISIAVSFLTSTWALTVLATVMFGMICITTINTDKTSGWQKVSRILPLSGKTVVDSKYILYIVLSCIGLLLGIALSIVISLLKGQFDYSTMMLVTGIGFDVALVSGCIAIPCAFLFTEEKSMLSMIIAYPVSAGVISGAAVLFDNAAVTCSTVLGAGIIMYIASWRVARNSISCKDVV